MSKICVEYAKSGRSACSSAKCKQKILKDELRIGSEVQFPNSSGEAATSWKWRHLCCFTSRQIDNANASHALDSVEGYDLLAASDKALFDQLKEGKLVDKTELIGRIGDTANAVKVVDTEKKKPTKRKRSPTADSPPLKKTAPLPPDDGTQDFDVEVLAEDVPLCPYGSVCLETDHAHQKQFRHGRGPRPVATKRV